MKSIKQIENDPRVFAVAKNPDWDPEAAANWPESHPSKYLLILKDGYVFDDPVPSGINGADAVKELNDLLKDIVEAVDIIEEVIG